MYGKTMMVVGSYLGSRVCNGGAGGVATRETVLRLRFVAQSMGYLKINGQRGWNRMLRP
jgi:hypothetical protein